MGCTNSKVLEDKENKPKNLDIAIKDEPKNKIVKAEVSESLKSYLKKENQEFSKLELSGGHSIYGESFVMEAKSLSNNSTIKYMYRKFKPVRDSSWEIYITKEMGLLGVAPKIIIKKIFGYNNLSKILKFYCLLHIPQNV